MLSAELRAASLESEVKSKDKEIQALKQKVKEQEQELGKVSGAY